MAVPTVYALYADEFVLCPDSAFVTHGVGTALALLSSWLFFCAAIEVRQLRHHQDHSRVVFTPFPPATRRVFVSTR